MSPQSPELARLQRWMQAVITHPAGIEVGMHSDTARGALPVDIESIERVITRSSAQSSADRLRIYGNAYFARLLECLRTEFPALVHLLGQEVFDGFAFGFLQRFPSRSYTLAHLGAMFAQYLEETRPETTNAQRPDFADLVIDLARLERAYSEVFDEPGPERQPGLQADALQFIPIHAWGNVRLQFYSCVRLMSFQFPVHEYAKAVRRSDPDANLPEAAATFVALTRRRYVVHHLCLSHPEFILLQRLRQGLSLGNAIDAESFGQLPLTDVELFEAFRKWSAAPLFCEVN